MPFFLFLLANINNLRVLFRYLWIQDIILELYLQQHVVSRSTLGRKCGPPGRPGGEAIHISTSPGGGRVEP